MKCNYDHMGEQYCLCSTCQSMRKDLEETEKLSKEEIDRMFNEAEELMEVEHGKIK